jgi:hypothetical protein
MVLWFWNSSKNENQQLYIKSNTHATQVATTKGFLCKYYLASKYKKWPHWKTSIPYQNFHENLVFLGFQR